MQNAAHNDREEDDPQPDVGGIMLRSGAEFFITEP
jgi:hypothetical protein